MNPILEEIRGEMFEIQGSSPLKIKSLETYRSANDPDLFLSFTCLGGGRIIASATGHSLEEAQLKALVETYERRISSLPPKKPFRFKIKTLRELGYNVIHPNDYVPTDHRALAEHGLKPVKDNKKYSWVFGTRWNGHIVLVPLEMVYYGFKHKDRIYYANSSGVAAHSDPELAKLGAVCELIERDAIMRSWYSQIPPKLIDLKALAVNGAPNRPFDRMNYWTTKNRTLAVWQLPSLFGEVYLAVIFGDKWPHFVCGAAATIGDDSSLKTIEKAVEEAEGNFEAYSSVAPQVLEAEMVLTPEDHGLYYCAPRHEAGVSYLKPTEETHVHHPEPNPVSLDEAMKRLDAAIVWLTDESAKLWVARVLSPKVVPISFGFMLDHFAKALEGLDPTSEQADTIKEMHSHPHFFP